MRTRTFVPQENLRCEQQTVASLYRTNKYKPHNRTSLYNSSHVLIKHATRLAGAKSLSALCTSGERALLH